MVAKKWNRRDFLKASAFGAAGFVAASSGLSIAKASHPTKSRTRQAATIQVIDPWAAAPQLADAHDAQIARFMESHPNIVVERSEIPFEEFRQLLIQGALANDIPDVVLIDNPDFHAFAALGVLADLTDAIGSWGQSDLYFSGHWSSTVYKGSNYGVPVFSNCLAWFTNTDMLETAGVAVPTTWDELREAAAALTTEDRFGLSLSATHSEEGTFQWLAFLWSAGSDIPTLNDEGGQAALQLWVDLVSEGYMSQGILGWGQWDAKDEFGNLRAAMNMNGPWVLGSLRDDYPDVNWQVSPIPSDKVTTSILGGENYGISSTSRNVEAAWEYIAWTQEPENYKQFLKDVQQFPSRMDVAEDTYWADDPVLSVFLAQIQQARPRAYGANYLEMSNAIQDAIQAAISGQKSVKEALDDAFAIIEPLLSE
ncbi:MAG: sugar ABC transporter substrate-binding protein [Anaerolineae bacterium]|nr:MAG: sugar ABC transporter substrate-binding protein [Anaerolineae bacterium]